MVAAGTGAGTEADIGVDIGVGIGVDTGADSEVGTEVAGIVIADIGGLVAAAAEPLRQQEIAVEDTVAVADIADSFGQKVVADIAAVVADIEVHVADIEVCVVDIGVSAVDTEAVLQWSPASSVAGAHCFRIIDGKTSDE